MFKELINDYNEAIYDTDRARAMDVIHNALEIGATPEAVIFELVIPAMNQMIKSISEDFDVNLAQYFMTAQIGGEVTDAMIARMESPPVPIGNIVIGTAAGDMHTLGKRIVIGCCKALMIESIDLGVNVLPERFVDEAVNQNASVIAVSAMMTHTASGKKGPLAVRELLRKRDLEGRIKLIVGGAPFRFDPELYKKVGADTSAEDGLTAGEVIRLQIQEVK